MFVSKIGRVAPSHERFGASAPRGLVEARDIEEAARIIQRLDPHCTVTHVGGMIAK